MVINNISLEEEVTLVGFGTFQVMRRKERAGRNLQIGDEIQIPIKKVPKFKSGGKDES